MSERFFGGAFVVLPHQDGLQTSQLVVSGEQKDDITIHSHEKVAFRGISDLRSQISDFVKEIITLQARGVKTTVSCGIANSIDCTGIVDGFNNRIFRKVLGRESKRFLKMRETFSLASQLSGADITREEGDMTVSRGILFNAMGDIFEKGVAGSKRLKVDRRAYQSAEEQDTLGIGKDMALFLGSHQVGMDLLNETYALLVDEDLLQGKKQADDRLKELVHLVAKSYAELLQHKLCRRSDGGKIINRFINIGHEHDIRNVIFVVPELREIFCRTFLEDLGFQHNVCIKPTWAKPSPPFGDVAATFVADMIDKRDGTPVSTASINYGEEYT